MQKQKILHFVLPFIFQSFAMCIPMGIYMWITNPKVVHIPNQKLSSLYKAKRSKSSSTEFTSFSREKIRTWLNFQMLTEMLLFAVIVLHKMEKSLARSSFRPGLHGPQPHTGPGSDSPTRNRRGQFRPFSTCFNSTQLTAPTAGSGVRAQPLCWRNRGSNKLQRGQGHGERNSWEAKASPAGTALCRLTVI